MSNSLVVTDPPQVWGVFQQTFVLASRYLESVSARFGLSHPQAAVLKVLREHGQALPLSRIARLLTQEAQSTTELADRLERRNYVRRTRDAKDRRLVLLELTDEGRAAIDEILPALDEARARLFEGIPTDAHESLVTVLEQMRVNACELGGKTSRSAVEEAVA